MSRSSVLASLASQDVSASEFDKLDADNGSDYQGQIDLKSPLASPTFTGSITTPEIRSGSTLTIDPATVGDNTGLVLLKGNLQVDGTSTTINSTTLTVDDLNLTLASGAADSAAANGAGITIDGASATMTYTHSTTSFDFNKPVNITGALTASDNRASQFASVIKNTHASGAGMKVFGATGTQYSFIVRDYTDNTNSLVVLGNGNVGIGQTAPTNTLHVTHSDTGDLVGGGGAFTTALRLENAVGGSGANRGTGIYFKNTGNDSVGVLGVETNSSNFGDFIFQTYNGGASFLDAMRITSSGNVGINCTPSAKLSIVTAEDTVYANVSPSVSDALLSLANIQTSESANDQAQIQFNVSGGSHNRVGSVGLVAESASNRKASLVFTTDEGSSRAEKMRITGDGNVGIGTTSPAGDLHISESSASEVRLQLTNSNTGHAGSDGFAIVLDAAATNQYFWNYESRDMLFGTNNSTQMTISSNGLIYGHYAGKVNVQITDNAVYSFTPNSTKGTMLIYNTDDAGDHIYQWFSYEAGSSKWARAFFTNGYVLLTTFTGAPAYTDATDGYLSLGPSTDGKLYVINRTGLAASQSYWSIVMIGR